MSEILKPVDYVTRFAPTPSGYLHLGNLYSFVQTFHIAKKNKAKILLRIDDLDRERVKKKYIHDIFDTLDFLEIPYDLGPKNFKEFKNSYSQLRRLSLYNTGLDQIRLAGKLFACDCSRSKIAKMHVRGFYNGHCKLRKLAFDAPEVCWRLQTPVNVPVSIHDLQAGPITGIIPNLLYDVVVRKKDGFPAYQMASVIDDVHFGVNLIIRGKDLWGSSLVQNFLSVFLPPNNFNQSIFYHHRLIKDAAQQKLSKSSGATSIRFLRKSGKNKSQVFQLLADSIGVKDKVNCLQDFEPFVEYTGTMNSVSNGKFQ